MTRDEIHSWLHEAGGFSRVPFNHEGLLEKFTWKFHPRFPVATLSRAFGSREAAIEWMREEERGYGVDAIRGGTPYFHAMREAWKSDPMALGPIILVEFSDGTIDVGDGWHRTAISLEMGLRHVPCIVGSPK